MGSTPGTSDGSAGEIVGQVTEADGDVTITTFDGKTVPAAVGMEIHLHDTIETDDGAHLHMTFVDGAKMAVAEASTMEVTKLVYDPARHDNGLLIDMPKGAFEFIAGKIAPSFGDGMQIRTPVGTLGVRGTAGAGKIDPETGAFHCILYKDPNGHLGKIYVTSSKGEVLLDDWMEATTLVSSSRLPELPHVLTLEKVKEMFGATTDMINLLHPQLEDYKRQEGVNGVEQLQHAPTDPSSGSGIFHQGSSDVHHLSEIAAISDAPSATHAVETAIVDGHIVVISDKYGEDDLINLFHDVFTDVGSVVVPVHSSDPGPYSGPEFQHGTAGNDTFSGSYGHHVYDGQGGSDTISYASASGSVDADLTTGHVAHNGYGGSSDSDTLTSVENIIGSNHGDHIVANDGTVANVIHGGTGNDTIVADIHDTVFGGAGNDHISLDTSLSGTFHIDGGSGLNDLTIINSTGTTLNLVGASAAGYLNNIQQVHLENSSGSSVILNASDVLDIGHGEMDFFGDATNAVSSVGQGWSLTGTSVVSGHTMDVYTNGSLSLLVEQSMIHNIS